MEISRRDVGEYLDSLPDDIGAELKTLDTEIAKAMKDLPRELYVGKFWGGSDQEIIGYGRYSYQRADKQEVEWFVVGLALQKNYISVYISAVEDGQYLSEKHGNDLGKVKVGKSSISFSSLDDIDLDKLIALVSKARSIQAGGV